MFYTLTSDHHCQVVALGCIDFRFVKAMNDFIKEKIGTEKYDLITLGGTQKNLAAPANEDVKNFVLRQFEISRSLHNTTQVFLIAHYDCGAYGGLAAFDNDPEKERTKHVEDLYTAKQILLEKFPGLQIYLYRLDKNSTSNEIEFNEVKHIKPI